MHQVWARLGRMARAHLEAVARAANDMIDATARRNAAMAAARESGETWQDIATAAGMTPNGVRRAVGPVGQGRGCAESRAT